MKILHVTPTYWPAVRYGGPIESLRRLCEAQARAGHDVTVATTSVDGPEDRVELEGEERNLDDVKVRYFRASRLRRLYHAPAMQRWLCSDEARAEVVHLHSVFLWPTLCAARIARRRGIPYVVSPRGMLVPALIRQRSRWLKRLWISAFERRTLREASRIIVSSRWEARQLTVLLGKEPAPISVVPHGVDAASSNDTPRARDLVVYVGRLSGEKRLDWVLRALPHVPELRLAVAGAGPEESALRSLAGRLGLGDRVAWMGHLDPFRRDRLLGSASAAVLASTSESFGNVVLESLACGTPMLVSDAVGARDVVEAAHAGAAFESVDELIGLLRSVAADPTCWRERGDRGREYVRRHCRWDDVASATVELYATSSAGP